MLKLNFWRLKLQIDFKNSSFSFPNTNRTIDWKKIEFGKKDYEMDFEQEILDFPSKCRDHLMNIKEDFD